jgi:hypothetical protein
MGRASLGLPPDVAGQEVLTERILTDQRHAGPPDGEVVRGQLTCLQYVATGGHGVIAAVGLGGDAKM